MTKRANATLGPQRISVLRLATEYSVLFLVLCCTYILVSGQIAARMSGSVEALRHIETVKGLVFMAVMSLTFFGLAYWGLHRIQRLEHKAAATQEALMDAERRALAGLFASSIAHDMRNILTIVGIGIEDLRTGRATLTQENVDKAFAELNQMANRLVNVGKEGMIQDFLASDLSEIVNGAVALGRSHPHSRDCRIVVHTPEPVKTEASAHLLQLAILNLILNSADATKGEGHIRVTLSREGQDAVIMVEDNGPGVPSDVRERLFTPFFTTKSGGTGLGLTSVKAVAQGHNGTIEVGRSDMGGARFTFRFPLK